MATKKMICLMLTLGLALVLACAAALAEDGEAALTLLVYMTGSNLESESGAATRDITEMLRSGAKAENVNILLMTGGSTKWWGGFPNDQLCIYRAAGNRPELLMKMDAASMGEPEALTQFLNYGYEHFPSAQYALIVWDHGGGPLEGVCYDELFGMDSLSMAELQTALEASPFSEENQLEWIGFDACLMCSVETAHVCAPYAKYMIASQETEPGAGWDYGFLREIGKNTSGAEIGRQIVDSYFEDSSDDTLEQLTLSCIDLARINAVEQAMDGLFGELDGIISPESFSVLSNSRRDAKNFGRATTGSEYDLVDLYHLAQQYTLIAPEKTDKLLSAIENAIVYQRSNAENSYGLSVYYPYYNKTRFQTVWAQIYQSLNFSQGYSHFLADYAELWLGEALADWSGLRTVALPQERKMEQELTLSLSEEQAEHFAAAEVYILDEFGSQSQNAYYSIYHMPAIEKERHTLSANYEYQALYALDKDGNPVSDALPYIVYDDTYLIRTVFSTIRAEDDFLAWAQNDLKPAYLQCKLDSETNELRVIGAIELSGVAPTQVVRDEDVLFLGKQTLTLDSDDWPWIQFIRQPQILLKEENGITPAFPDWPSYGEGKSGAFAMEYYSVDNRQPWTLKFCRQQYNGSNLWAQFVVTDTQGERFASALLPIENPNIISGIDAQQILFDDDDLQITLDSLHVVDSANEAGMYLHGKIMSNQDVNNDMDVRKVLFNQSALSQEDWSARNFMDIVGNPNSCDWNLYIPSSQFPPMSESRVRSLSFEIKIGSRSIPIAIDCDLELGDLAVPVPDLSAPLSEAEVDQAFFQLLSLSEAEDGSLIAEIHVVNHGQDTLELNWGTWGDVAINGCFFSGASRGKTLALNSGCELYTTVPLEAVLAKPDALGISMPFNDFPVTNGFDYWGIQEIEQVSLNCGQSTVCFDLKQPLPLRETHIAPEEKTLFSAGGLSISLRGVEVTDGTVCLEIVVKNSTETSYSLHLEELSVDHQPVEASMEIESDLLMDGTFFPLELAPGLTQRGRIEFSWLQSNLPDSLELHFQYQDEMGNWQYISEVEIKPAIGTIDQLDIKEGKQLSNDPVDAMTWFEPRVEMPENAEQYHVTLAAHLTPEQIKNEQYIVMMIAKPQVEDGVNAYRILYMQKNVVPDDAGWLCAEYSGLMPSAAGQTDPILVIQTTEEARGGCMPFANIGFEAALDHPDLSFDSIVIQMNPDTGAQVTEVKANRELSEAEQFEDWISVYYTLIPSEGDNGLLTYPQNWKTPSMFRARPFPFEDGRVHFSLNPAAEENLYVFFSVLNKDGTGYTLNPIPYREAVLNQEGEGKL